MTSTISDTTPVARTPHDVDVVERGAGDDLSEHITDLHRAGDSDGVDLPSRIRRSVRSLGALGARDLFLLAAIFLLPCAYFPVFNSWYWTSRVMILLIAVPLGGLALARLLRTRDRAAVLATAALCWSVLGALGTDPISHAVHGVIGQDASVLSYTGAIGLWALARCSSQRTRRLVLPVLFGSLGLNLVVGFAQVLFGVDRGDLSLQNARAVGMTPNAVYFGALMAAGSALAIRQAINATNKRWAWWCGAALMFAACVSFSGSRVAAGSLVVVGAALVVIASGRRAVALCSFLCAMFGMLIGSALARVLDLDSDSVSRLSNTGSGGRVVYWRAALEAITERPLHGWGLGQFRAAVQGRLSLDELVPFGSAQTFWDAHNVFVGLAVAVGIPGLILFLSFAVVAGRKMPAHLVPAFAAIAITWMLQPGGLTTLPLVVMLLGFSRENHDEDAARPATRRWQRIGAVGLVTTGVVAALWVGVADARLELAVQSGDPVAAQAAASMFGDDPVANDLVAKMLESEGYATEEQQAAILDAFELNTELEPNRAFWWTQLARRQGQFGDPDAAFISTQRALALEPFNQDAWAVSALVARDLGDANLEREALSVLCTYGNDVACEAQSAGE